MNHNDHTQRISDDSQSASFSSPPPRLVRQETCPPAPAKSRDSGVDKMVEILDAEDKNLASFIYRPTPLNFDLFFNDLSDLEELELPPPVTPPSIEFEGEPCYILFSEMFDLIAKKEVLSPEQYDNWMMRIDELDDANFASAKKVLKELLPTSRPQGFSAQDYLFPKPFELSLNEESRDFICDVLDNVRDIGHNIKVKTSADELIGGLTNPIMAFLRFMDDKINGGKMAIMVFCILAIARITFTNNSPVQTICIMFATYFIYKHGSGILMDLLPAWLISQPQSNQDDITDLVIETLSMGMFAKRLSFESLKGFGMSLKEFDVHAASFRDNIVRIKDWVLRVIRLIAEACGLEFALTLGNHESTFKYIKDLLQEIIDEHKANGGNIKQGLSDKVQRLDQLILDLDFKLPVSAANQPMRNVLNSYVIKLAPIKKLVEETGFLNRTEPMVVYIVSHPGTGKTFLDKHITSALAPAVMTRPEVMDFMTNPSRSVFSHPVGSKFLDGYVGQPIYSMNDCFTATDMKGSESEATFLINAIGSNEYKLPIAVAEKKGKVRFLSKLVVINGNVTHINESKQFESIRTPGALIRRLNQECWYMTVREPFRKAGKFKNNTAMINETAFSAPLDLNKVYDPKNQAGLDPETGVNYNVNLFYRWDVTTNKPKEPLEKKSLFALIEHLKEVYASRTNESQVKMNAEAIMLKRACAARLKELPAFVPQSKDETVYTDADESVDSMDYFDKSRTEDEILEDEIDEFKKRLKKDEGACTEIFTGNSTKDLNQFIIDFLKKCYHAQERIEIQTDEDAFHNDVGHPINKLINETPFVELEKIVKLKLSDKVVMTSLKLYYGGLTMTTSIMKALYIGFEKFRWTFLAIRKNFWRFYMDEPLMQLALQGTIVGVATIGAMHGFNAFMKFIDWFFGCSPKSGKKGKKNKVDKDNEPEDVPKTNSKGRIIREENQEVELTTLPSRVQSNMMSGKEDDYIMSRLENCWVISAERTVMVDDKVSTYSLSFAYFWFLGGRVGFCNFHVIEQIRMLEKLPGVIKVQFCLTRFHNTYKNAVDYRCEFSDVKVHDNLISKDIMVLELPNINHQPNLIKHLPRKSDTKFCEWMKNSRFKMDVLWATRGDKTVSLTPTTMLYKGTHVWYKLAASVKDVVNDKIVGKEDLGMTEHNVYHDESYALHTGTKKGDCCAVAFLTAKERMRFTDENPLYQNPTIVYFHNSGDPAFGEGQGRPMYREDFDFVLDIIKTHITPLRERLPRQLAMVEEEFKAIAPSVCHGSCFELNLGSVRRPGFEAHHQIMGSMALAPHATKSQIKRSILYGIAERTRAPGVMYNYVDEDGILVNQLSVARKDYGSNTDLCINAKSMTVVTNYVCSKILSNSNRITSTDTLTIEESILGCPAHNLAALGMDTSVGPTLGTIKRKMGYSGKGKTWIFGNGDKPDLERKEAKALIRLVQKFEKELMDGDKCLNIYGDCLKDALMEYAKIKKPRLFCSGDVFKLMLDRMYFGVFAGWVMDSRVRNGICIGINPFSMEWDAAYDHLATLSPLGIFGDYSKYDKKLIMPLIYATLTLIRMFYGDSDPVANGVRELLFEDFVNSLHSVPDGDENALYEWLHGNTSGNFLTAIINSVANIVIIIYCLLGVHMARSGLYITKDSIPMSMLEFVWFNNRHLTYGDDNAITVTPDLNVNFYDLQDAIKIFFSLDYTDELKGANGEVAPYRPVSEGNFISRGFLLTRIRGERRVKSPLKLRSILEMPQWNKLRYSVADAIINAETALIELGNHDIDTFNKYGPAMVRSVFDRTGTYLVYNNYEIAEEALDRRAAPQYYRLWDNPVDSICPIDLKSPFLLFNKDLIYEDLRDLCDNPRKILRSSEVEGGLKLTTKECNNNLVVSSGLESREAPSHDEMYVEASIPQSDHVENRLDGGEDLNNPIMAPVVCDNSRTTCWVESEGKKVSSFQLPKMGGDVEVRTEGIEQFLAKPQLLKVVSYTSLTAPNTDLFMYDIADSLALPEWKNKIQGFGLIRGTFNVRLELNAYPFQAGKVILRYLPNYRDFKVSTCPRADGIYNQFLVSKYQHPFVSLDMRETTAEMSIPYIAPTQFYDIKNAQFDWGRFWITAPVALKTGASGAQNADISVYVYWTDVELSAPSIPQSGTTERRVGKSREEKETNMSLSQGLKVASKAVGILGNIPYLSAAAAPVSWALNLGSGLISAFGWSKPRIDTPPIIAARSMLRYSGVADGADVSVPLSMITKNEIEVVNKYSITGEDEMSLPFLIKIPNYVTTLNWKEGMISNTPLYGSPMTFDALSTTGTELDGAITYAYIQGAPIWYLSNFFDLWRGDLILTLQFVKTQYHTGRIQIAWTPGSNIGNIPDVTTGVLSLRHIVDIRDQSIVTLNLPYMLQESYAHCNALTAGPGRPVYSGYLSITVLNELRTPETCADNLDILMFIQGGDNFEFQSPTFCSKGVGPYIPQSDSAETIVSCGIADTKIQGLTTHYSGSSVGEHFVSVKQLLNKCSQFFGLGGALEQPTNVLFPWWVGAVTHTPTGAKSANLIGDAYSFIAPMYAYYRGSARVALVYDRSAAGTDFDAHVWATNPVGFYSDTAGWVNPSNLGASIITGSPTPPATLAGPVGIYPFQSPIPNDLGVGIIYNEVPYYSQTPVSLVQWFDGLTPSVTGGVSTPVSCVNFSTSATLPTGTMGLRSFSDDFTLSFFIGCPPLLYKQT